MKLRIETYVGGTGGGQWAGRNFEWKLRDFFVLFSMLFWIYYGVLSVMALIPFSCGVRVLREQNNCSAKFKRFVLFRNCCVRHFVKMTLMHCTRDCTCPCLCIRHACPTNAPLRMVLMGGSNWLQTCQALSRMLPFHLNDIREICAPTITMFAACARWRITQWK